MARARNIKPGFFTDERIVELSFEARLLFIGLWTLADREGRLDDKPKQIKMSLFPADSIDLDALLRDLHGAGLVLRYVVDSKGYIQITNFRKHQNPHLKEKASTIPAPDKHGASPADSLNLIPDSLNTESRSPVRVSISPEEQEHIDNVLDGLRDRFNVLTIPDEFKWVDAAEWSYRNKLTPTQFLECYDLLAKQEWRDSAVSAQTVMNNLPHLARLRGEQNGSKNTTEKRLPTPAEKLAEIERHQREHPRTPPPADLMSGLQRA